MTERQLKALWVKGVINEETFANRPGASPSLVVVSNRVLCTVLYRVDYITYKY